MAKTYAQVREHSHKYRDASLFRGEENDNMCPEGWAYWYNEGSTQCPQPPGKGHLRLRLRRGDKAEEHPGCLYYESLLNPIHKYIMDCQIIKCWSVLQVINLRRSRGHFSKPEKSTQILNQL